MRVVAQPLEFDVRKAALFLKQAPTFVVDEAELATDRRQSQVGIVLAQQQPVLRAAREHPIRLARAAGDEIIDEDADVGVAALRQPWLAPFALERRVDPGQRDPARLLLHIRWCR